MMILPRRCPMFTIKVMQPGAAGRAGATQSQQSAEEETKAMAITFGKQHKDGCYEDAAEKNEAGKVCCHTQGDMPARSRRASKLQVVQPRKQLLKKKSQSMTESETIPVMKQIPHRRESIVFRELDRSTNSYKQVSKKADSTIDRIEKVLDLNKDSQRQFFQARRKIAEAACKIAKEHKIGLQMLDDDSDDERSNFFSGVSTSQSSNLNQQ